MSEVLVIDRSIWSTGTHGKGITQLLNDHGYKCCLGFECLRLGCMEDEIRNEGDPCEVLKPLTNLNDFNEGYNENGDYFSECYSSEFAIRAMKINDDENIDDEIREDKISEHFKKVGITVEFINEYNTINGDYDL